MPAIEPQEQRPADGHERHLRRVDVRTLLGDEREMILVHRDAEYRLRLTSNGKLILTK
ncbi:MAG: hemin uptake protein HemP [Alphaproteobacteria bacterium]